MPLPSSPTGQSAPDRAATQAIWAVEFGDWVSTPPAYRISDAPLENQTVIPGADQVVEIRRREDLLRIVQPPVRVQRSVHDRHRDRVTAPAQELVHPVDDGADHVFGPQ